MKLVQQSLGGDDEIENNSNDEDDDDDPDYKERGLNNDDEVEVVGSDEDVNEDNLTTADIIYEDNGDGNLIARLKIWGEVMRVNAEEKKRHQLEATSFPADQRSQTPLGCRQRRLQMLSIGTIRIGKHTRTGNGVSGVSRAIC